MFCTGLCFGPILHYTYELYEYVLPINIDAVCADTVVTPAMTSSRTIVKSYCPFGGCVSDDGNTIKCSRGGEGRFPSSEQTMSTNDMLLLADGTMIMKHDKQLLSSSNITTNNHHHENNQRVDERNNNDDDGNNDFIIRSSNTFVEEEYVDSTTETTTTHYQETSDCCHSTMFHSYYTISHRKFINAFLHVVIDQGIMGFVFIALMMLITGIIEGHYLELQTIFVNDYITNIYFGWWHYLLLGQYRYWHFDI
jgi:hypothetical protein